MRKTVLFAILWTVGIAGAFAASFDDRAADFCSRYGAEGTKGGLYGVFRQLARMGAKMPLEEDEMYGVYDVIKSNRDCNDFTLNGLLRMLYLDSDSVVISGKLRHGARERVLDFKYWWDDARRDSTYRCYHTENHQALYHTAELLAGQLYPDERFADGKTGREHIVHATELIVPWLDFRFRFGFSEFLSTYYDVEVLLLSNLYDFADDESIRNKARAVLDILMFDMALNTKDGLLCAASGRTYASSLLTGIHTTAPLARLAFGTGTSRWQEVTGAVALATGSYRVPAVIEAVAVDRMPGMLSRMRTSINVEDAPGYGISYDTEPECHIFWGMQEFVHPLTVNMSKRMSHSYNTWPYGDYDSFIEAYEQERARGREPADRDCFAIPEGNIVTFRTPDYMLSTLQDFRKGLRGYQQHVWQATLAPDVIVYTNHPGGTNMRNSPNYWAGNLLMPRAAQHRNVSCCIYDIPSGHETPYSHAYFPAEAMDSVRTVGKWHFGCKDDAYVALWASDAGALQTDFRGKKCEIRSSGNTCVWLCETGSASEWGSFDAFVAGVASANVACDGTSVCYTSPSCGEFSFGWDEPLTVDGGEVALRHSCRYDNPFCKAPFDADSIVITYADKKYTITNR